jgi:flagellar biosynthetic protein FlhB
MLRDQDIEDRTEEPTPRRREEARRSGDVPRSPGLVLSLALLASFGALAWTGPMAAASIVTLFTELLAGAGTPGLDAERARGLLLESASALGTALLPFMALSFAGSLAAAASQCGAGFEMSGIRPRLGNLTRGAGRGGFAERILGGVARPGAVAICIPFFIPAAASAFDAGAEALARNGVVAAFAALSEGIPGIGLRTALVLVALGLLGRLLAGWRHGRRLRMTRREVREERELVEGKPLWKGQRRRIQDLVLARVRSRRGGRR